MLSVSAAGDRTAGRLHRRSVAGPPARLVSPRPPPEGAAAAVFLTRPLFPAVCSYLVMPFMGTDLGKLMKMERLTADRVQFLVYQMLRGLKVTQRHPAFRASQSLKRGFVGIQWLKTPLGILEQWGKFVSLVRLG